MKLTLNLVTTDGKYCTIVDLDNGRKPLAQSELERVLTYGDKATKVRLLNNFRLAMYADTIAKKRGAKVAQIVTKLEELGKDAISKTDTRVMDLKKAECLAKAHLMQDYIKSCKHYDKSEMESYISATLKQARKCGWARNEGEEVYQYAHAHSLLAEARKEENRKAQKAWETIVSQKED